MSAAARGGARSKEWPATGVVDLRSDTVTRPTAEMREEMARAEVGDDVFGEDPTVAALESHVAELFGKEGALFVPSGTMANQISLLAWCRPGDGVLVSPDAHVLLYEAGGAGALAGVQLFEIGRDGLFDADDVRERIFTNPYLNPPTRLVSVENTHNRAGGRVVEPERLARISAACREARIPLHMDGARCANACVALGVEPRVLAEPVDSLSICLSKGLGAPVGSLLVGSHDFIDRARRYRKMLGGGMRQSGILAAAGMYAIQRHWHTLAEDHRRARELAQGWSQIPGLRIDPATVATNIVIANVDLPDVSGLIEAMGEAGVLIFPFGSGRVRAVLHREIGDSGVERAIAAMVGACREAAYRR